MFDGFKKKRVLIWFLTSILMFSFTLSFANVTEMQNKVIMDNGYIKWGVTTKGKWAVCDSGIIEFPHYGEEEVGKLGASVGGWIPLGYCPSYEEAKKHPEKNFHIGDERYLKTKYKILCDNENVIKVEFEYKLPAQECTVTYTLYNRDNKVFIDIDYIPVSEELNTWEPNNVYNINMVGNLSITPVSPALGQNIESLVSADNGVRKLFWGEENTGLYYYKYNLKDEKICGSDQRVDWIAARSIEYKRMAGLIVDPDSQSESETFGWFVLKQLNNPAPYIGKVCLKKPIKTNHHYKLNFIYVIEATDNFDPLINTYKAFDVKGKLRGEFSEQPSNDFSLKVFKWSNPRGANNIKIVGSIEADKIGSGAIKEVRVGKTGNYSEAKKIDNWWVLEDKFYFLSDINEELYVFIKK